MSQEIPVYDVSGICFALGVSTFTLENVYSACRSAGIYTRENLHIQLSLDVYDSLDSRHLINHFNRNGEQFMTYHRFTVSIEPNHDPKRRLSECIISDPEGRKVMLITREY